MTAMRTTVDERPWAIPPDSASSKGEGRPVGLQARARAILTDTQGDGHWARATLTWDQVRAEIRRIPEPQQFDAWRLAADAMAELRADVARQFGDIPEEEKPDDDDR